MNIIAIRTIDGLRDHEKSQYTARFYFSDPPTSTGGPYAIEFDLFERSYDHEEHPTPAELADPDRSGAEVHGHVKWDGCVNWMSSSECMGHFCAPDDMDSFVHAFRCCLGIADELLHQRRNAIAQQSGSGWYSEPTWPIPGAETPDE